MLKIPLLLDTDIGSDIDDAVALAYLLRQPRCDLLGVTTVSGDVAARAALADAVCRAGGRDDIPIHAGCSEGLLKGVIQPEVPQAVVLKDFDHRHPTEFAPNSAVEFLRDQINARHGEITLLAIGPMTNIGLLFASDPSIAKKLKRLVLMCGVFTTRTPHVARCEWNARLDPIATALTYHALVAEHISIGLDVTTRCQISTTDAVARFRAIGGPLSVVAAATEIWKHHSDKVTFHDPLAAAVIFEPTLCKMQQGRVTVELTSPTVPGMTHFAAEEKGPHQIAIDVDSPKFFDHYFSTVSKS